MRVFRKAKGIMLYDGDCGFCKRWIRRFKRITRNNVVYEPYQEALAKYPQFTKEQCALAVQLLDIQTDGQYSGAGAVFKAISYRAGAWAWLLKAYESWGWFRSIADWCYNWVARNRHKL